MPLEFFERATSRGFEITTDSSTVPKKWMAAYSNDPSAVYAGLVAVAPVTVVGLRRQSIKANPVGGGVWECEINYGWTSQDAADAEDNEAETPDDDTQLGVEYGFDIQAEQVHITQSLRTVSSVGLGGAAAPNFKGAIGVTKDRVEGCDVYAPNLQFSVKAQRQRVTLPYMRLLRAMTGKVNATAWRGLAAGEVLYLGASGTAQPPTVGDPKPRGWEVTHKFASKENLVNIDLIPTSPSVTLTGTRTSGTDAVTGITDATTYVGYGAIGTGIPPGTTVSGGAGTTVTLSQNATTSGTGPVTFVPPGGITVASKEGWDYLWTSYLNDTDLNVLIQRPQAAYVERVFRRAEFRLLEIGA